jgi:hypothetical protein
LLGQPRSKWPVPWQWWDLMFDVRLIEMGDEEGFSIPAPCKTEALLGSVVQGAIVEGVNDVEGGC